MRITTTYGFEMDVNLASFFGQTLAAKRCYEEAESELVSILVRPGDFCVDAGCHAGYFTCLMAKCGGRVLAVDANPAMVELTTANAAVFSNVWVVHAGLSNENGTAQFYIPSVYNDGWGSLAAADDLNGSMTVPTRRLDKFLLAGSIRLVKMDVEGYEAQALEGLGEQLKNVDYLLVECVDIEERVRASGSCVERINDILLKDFDVSAFEEGRWQTVVRAYSSASYAFWFRNKKFAADLEKLR